MLALISVAVIVILTTMGGNLKEIFTKISDQLKGAAEKANQ
ncbi:Flp family type IVb pilin [Helcococcus ovis]